MRSYLQVFAVLFFQFQLCLSECNDVAVEKLKTSSVILNTSPRTIVEYRLTETELHVTMTSEKIAYLGFGYASDGTSKMLGNTGIIGTLSNPSNPTSGSVLKHSMTSFSQSGVNALDSSRQTLLNAAYEAPVVLSNGFSGSRMKFTMLLDDGEEKIDTSAKVGRFIYAVGSDHFLTFHSAFGSAELSLEACQVLKEGEDQEKPAEDPKAVQYKNQIRFHAVLAVLSFGLLMPVAICAASFRAYLTNEIGGKQLWMWVHMGANVLSFLLATGVIALAFMAKNAVQASHLLKYHERVGLTVYIMVTLQVFSAFFRPSPNPVKEVSDDITPIDPEPASSMELAEEANDEIVPLKKKAFTKRDVWRMQHLTFGLVVGALFMYTIYSGIGEYELKFGVEQRRKIVYWVWLGLIIAFVLVRMWVRR